MFEILFGEYVMRFYISGFKVVDKERKLEVGTIVKDIYITKRTPRQVFYKWVSFGISEEILNLLLEKNVKTVRIVYKTLGGKVKGIYECPIDVWLNGKRFEYKKDTQRHVTIEELKKYEVKNDTKISE